MSIETGQASAHNPSVAQVSSASYWYASRSARDGQRPGALHRPPDDDALARGQREVAARAERLAEAALDALVDLLLDFGQRLEVLEVRVGIVVDEHAGVEQPFGIDQRLHAHHDLERRAAPLGLDERRHVPSGAVLGLQRAVVLPDHHLDEVDD